MLLELTSLTQIGMLPHRYFEQPPHSSAHIEDSETQAPDDMDDDGFDT
jgi:hypothetical protein